MTQDTIAWVLGFAALFAALILVNAGHWFLAVLCVSFGGLALNFAGFCGGIEQAEQDAKAEDVP